MRIISIEGNTQRLDGGSMFGNAPRIVWERWCPPDEQHRVPLACRALLVREDSGRNILFETGIGAFFAPKLKDRFGVMEEGHILLDSLAREGLSPAQIDVIVLSHLHFDHAGGALSAFVEGQEPSLAFPKARYVVGARHWERARAPHVRDRASFIPELLALLEQSTELELVEGSSSRILGAGYELIFSDGHTPGLMMTRMESSRGPVFFVGDLIPGIPWIHLPITMGYDRFPERLIDEKRALLDRVIEEGAWVFFTHDPALCACGVQKNEKGRYVPRDAVASVGW